MKKVPVRVGTVVVEVDTILLGEDSSRERRWVQKKSLGKRGMASCAENF